MKELEKSEIEMVSGAILPLLVPAVGTWLISFAVYSMAVLYEEKRIPTATEYIIH